MRSTAARVRRALAGHPRRIVAALAVVVLVAARWSGRPGRGAGTSGPSRRW
ncbi:hypothetical protein V2I01_10530 [Micromonospora sp. BRA006-A]|nr:hypothetical protein [Micromonospora sp. BRA006-A]